MFSFYAFLIIALIVAGGLAVTSICVIKQYQQGVVFKLGKFSHVAKPGLNFIIPIYQTIHVVDMRIKTESLSEIETITKDNVSLLVDSTVWYNVVDAEKSVINIEDYEKSIVEFAVVSLRNLIGKHTLDDILSNRDVINTEMKAKVNDAVDKWGVSVVDIEIKSIELPKDIERAMALEAQAIREKKARLIKADAELEASKKLVEAAGIIQSVPISLELRRMQMLTEIGAEQNTTTMVMIPSEFTNLAAAAKKFFDKKSNSPTDEL